MESIGYKPCFNVNFQKAVAMDKPNTTYFNKDISKDSFEKNNNSHILNKKEILKKARETSSGYSIIFGPFSTLYFGLRSDKAVAKKFNLDIKKDEKLIKNIKIQQMLWTIPGIIPLYCILPATVAWLYNKNLDNDKIKI